MSRILYVEGNPDGTVGGSFFSLFFLVQGLDRRRFEPVVAFSADNPLIPRFQDTGAAVLIQPPMKPVAFKSALLRPLSKLLNFINGFVVEPLKLARLIRRERIDIVHLNNSIIRNHEWMIGAMFARVPCMTHERGINPSYSTRSVMLGRRLEYVVCISKAVAENFAKRGVSGLKLAYVPNGLDAHEMRAERPPAEVRAELGIAPDARVIGMVGNFKEWKGQEVLIRAMRRVHAEFPDVVCMIVGDSSSAEKKYRDHVDSLIREFGLERHVVITGYRQKVADYVNTMEAMVHASIEPEPFGRVLLEAMALSKPLVASNGGAVPEIVLDGVTGILFTPGDDVTLAAGLAELLRDPAKVREMGQAGYQRLTDHFGVSRNVASTQDLYESILGNGHSAAGDRRVVA